MLASIFFPRRGAAVLAPVFVTVLTACSVSDDVTGLPTAAPPPPSSRRAAPRSPRTSASFTVTGLSAASGVVITGTLGATSRSAQLTVQ